MNIYLFTYFLTVSASMQENYWQERKKLIDSSRNEAIGADIVLTRDEQKVNDILVRLKLEELDRGFDNLQYFLPAQHFFKARDKIRESKVFKIIQKLPKGASLHSHDTALVSEEYLYKLTFRDDLYATATDGRLKLRFFSSDRVPEDEPWKPIFVLRQNDAYFDAFLKSQITLVVDDPRAAYPDINSVWNAFMDVFITVEPLICYKPVFQDYFYHALKELYFDNVMYLEFRGLLPEVYDLNGQVYGPIEVAGFYYETLLQFKEDYPDFHGARFIYAPLRKVDQKTADEYVEIFGELKRRYPDFIAGFDLVGQEDLGYPLIEFLPQLLKLRDETKFFFHAGETNWFGLSSDLNVFDAVLLNASRIGHGNAIVKHPKIMELVKRQKIAIEISPISNQVLRLVEDFRNHPGSIFIANGFPVVITCDDPTFWGAEALSYDWYLAFMGLASREGDLRLLKQLALNSLFYSAMEEHEKRDALKKWEENWNRFIEEILKGHSDETAKTLCRSACSRTGP